MVAQHLLLDFLADRHQQKDTALSLSARTFLTCRLFADELTSLRAAAALTQQQQAQLLVKYHNTSEQLEKGLVCDLNAGGLASNALPSLFAREGSSLCLYLNCLCSHPMQIANDMHNSGHPASTGHLSSRTLCHHSS